MCQPKPGPRCASHLTGMLSANGARLRKAQQDGDVAEEMAAESERTVLKFDYAGTRTGQRALQDKIDALDDPQVAADLASFRTRARNAYQSKVQALRSSLETAAPTPQPGPASPASASAYSGGKGGKHDPYTPPRPAAAAKPEAPSPAPAPRPAHSHSYRGKGGK